MMQELLIRCSTLRLDPASAQLKIGGTLRRAAQSRQFTWKMIELARLAASHIGSTWRFHRTGSCDHGKTARTRGGERAGLPPARPKTQERLGPDTARRWRGDPSPTFGVRREARRHAAGLSTPAWRGFARRDQSRTRLGRSRHYYQGKLGRRLWSGSSRSGCPWGRARQENEAFCRGGPGLTDLVKPCASADDLGVG